MYIAVGGTALRVIRALRCDHVVHVFSPAMIRDRQIAFDEGGGVRFEVTEHPVSLSGLTLADMAQERSFDFDAVRAQAKVDLPGVGDLGAFTPDDPCHLGVFSRRDRVWRKAVRCHLLSRSLPVESLVIMGPQLAFAAPELAVIQMSATAEPLVLVQTIMELCGSYSVSPVPVDDVYDTGTVFGVPPVMSLQSLDALAARVRVPNKQALTRAMELALEGAASPAEANLALALSLPVVQGGYQMGTPALNVRVDVPEHLVPRVSQQTYFLDVFYEDCLVDLEYESTAFHLDPLLSLDAKAFGLWRQGNVIKADADRRRARELAVLGIRPIPVTAYDLRSVTRMDQVAWSLATQRERVAGIDMAEHMAAATDPRTHLARMRLLEQLAGEPHVVW